MLMEEGGDGINLACVMHVVPAGGNFVQQQNIRVSWDAAGYLIKLRCVLCVHLIFPKFSPADPLTVHFYISRTTWVLVPRFWYHHEQLVHSFR